MGIDGNCHRNGSGGIAGRSSGGKSIRIEQALRNANVAISGPEGYVVAYAVAEDNLRLGHTVIADSVNPVEATLSIAWRQVALRAGKRCIEIEIVCSDECGAPSQGRDIGSANNRRAPVAHMAGERVQLVSTNPGRPASS